MKILYEKSLVYGEAFFGELGDCESFETHQLKPHDLQDVDALLVRSTTKVNAELLQHANQLSFVATGTAGFDHLDIPLLEKRGVKVHTAAGCNAVAVAEYVLSCLFVARQKFGLDLANATVGIVGAGHVGTALTQKLDALKIQYKLCDPLLEATDDGREFCTIDDILACDVISLHVPYTKVGPHPTEKLLCETRLKRLRQDQIIINACRGEVIDEGALFELLSAGSGPQVFLDVWENEPTIDQTLFPYVHIATPHIAGHTLEGKARGTEFVYQGLTSHFAIPCEKTIYNFLPKPEIEKIYLSESMVSLDIIQQLILLQYDCRDDDLTFRLKSQQSIGFTEQRKAYRVRREFSALTVICQNENCANQLAALGFSVAVE